MNCNHYDCNNRTALGYCNVTACTNPKYNGSGTYVEGRRIEMSEEGRLTERNDDGTAYYPAFVDVLDVESHRDCVVSLIDRLAVYEDTGLSPEEIKGLHIENLRLRDQLEYAEDRIDEAAGRMVVRCGECKHGEKRVGKHRWPITCNVLKRSRHSEDTCEQGERSGPRKAGEGESK